jgi:glycosyltransferase involved in cell wall biosynthesis
VRILYHHRVAAKDGQDVHITEMIAAMRRAGHEVAIVAPAMAEQTEFGGDSGLVERLRKLLPGSLYEIIELCYSIPAFFRLWRTYRGFRPDLLYERYNLFYLPGLWLRRLTGLPYLLEVNSPLAEERARHSGLKLQGLAKWSERAVWRGADLTMPVSAVLACRLRAEGVSAERILVVHNGVYLKHFEAGTDGAALRREWGLEGKLILGFTGFVREWHGLPQVLDVMASLPDRPDLHLLVIGDGPGLAPLWAHAQSLGMSDRLTCRGLLPRDKIAAAVAAFDIALQPMVVDYASPLKLFEYMALGRAILAPDQANIREILTDERDALLFPPGDQAALKAQLTRLCQDAGLRQRLGEQAATTIHERGFTWDDNVRRVLNATSLSSPRKRGSRSHGPGV